MKTIEETLNEDEAAHLNPGQIGLTDVDRAHRIMEYAGLGRYDACTTDYLCEHFEAVRLEASAAVTTENEMLQAERDSAANINERLKAALRRIQALAGNPDPAEGARQIIRAAGDALEGKEWKEGGYMADVTFTLDEVQKQEDERLELLCEMCFALGFNASMFFDGDDGCNSEGVIETMTRIIKEAKIGFDQEWLKEEYPSAEM